MSHFSRWNAYSLYDFLKKYDNLGLSLQSFFLNSLGCISRNPCYAELRRMAEACASKTTGDMSLFVSYDGNRQKALIRIPFAVKHITKCLCFRLKKKIQILNGKNISNEIVSRKKFRERHCVTLRSHNIMSLRSYIENISLIRRCDNLGLSLQIQPSLQSVFCTLSTS